MANPFARAARMQTGWHASFAGASTSRLFYDWAVRAISPDREIQYALRPLRSRARDLVRNNPFATGIVEAFADNVVGWEGIRIKPNVRDRVTGKLARPVNLEIARAWLGWGVCECASADGMESWLELQRLLVKTYVTDGEVFIRERKGFDNPYGYALELLDADLLDEGFNRPPDQDGVEIRMGVEVNRSGRPLAYHFHDRHPSDIGGIPERKRIPAKEIIHFFTRYRPGQTRGYSLFASVLTTLKMVDGLTEAELVASRMAAAKMGFITNDSPEAIAAYAERLSIQNDDLEGELEPRDMEVAPGVIEELMPGQGFEDFDPTHPNTAFEAFLKVMLRGVARGFGMSYLTLTGDVAEANYSSMRAGLIPERDHWRILQTVLAGRVHRRIYAGWLGMSILSKAVALPTSVPSDYLAHKWRPRGWKWVDPLKDLLALELAVSLGVDSRSNGAAQQGHDFEAVVDELADEQEYADERDVDVSGLKSERHENQSEDNDTGNGSRNGRLVSRVRALMTDASRNGED